MKLTRCRSFLVLVILSIACPTQAFSADQPKQSIQDIQLNDQAMLVGAIVTPAGLPAPSTGVEILSGKHTVAKVVTDQQGRFRVKGLRSGIHAVRTRYGVHACRFWPSTSAPPAARKGLILTTGNVVRGQVSEGINGATLLALGGFAAVTATTIALSVDSEDSPVVVAPASP